jgi:hypothetical protein
LTGIGNRPIALAPTIPENLYMIFQWYNFNLIVFIFLNILFESMFACITASLAFGGAAERAHV